MRSSRRRGATLVETTMAATLTLFVLAGALAALFSGMRSWIIGASKIQAEVDGTQAIRSLGNELREAMSVTVASDGLSVTYRLPQTDANGNFLIPPVWDGVQRRAIVTANGNSRFDLAIGISGSEAVLSRNVILIDPEAPGGTSYRPFTAGPGSITRRLDLMLVTRTSGPSGEPVFQRVRETLFLRNIPSITQ